MKTKIDIISGFLGAGKTTLIKKLLEEGLHNEKLVIVENEFGQIGIDGSILKKSNAAVREINSGCICCSLAGDFEEAVRDVISKYKPDRIIIEPSGVGKLSDVLKAFEAPELKNMLAINMVITVVDVIKFNMYLSNFGEFFENQIKNAKTVVLSRTQKSESKKTENVVCSIHKLNSKCSIVTTPWESISARLIMSAAEQDMASGLEDELKKAVIKGCNHHGHCECGHRHHSHQSHGAHEVFDVWGTETPRIFTKKDLEEIMRALESDASLGMALRGKGILPMDGGKWCQFDYVPGEFEIRNTGADYTGRICIIGRGLNKDKLSGLFEEA